MTIKKKDLIFIFVLHLLSCTPNKDARNDKGQNDTTTVEVSCDSVDIGRVSVGDSIQIVYVLKNIGKTPLYIEDVELSCDCTTAEFSHEEVVSGDSTTIILTYKAEGSPGYLYRTADVICNSVSAIELVFTGYIDDFNGIVSKD